MDARAKVNALNAEGRTALHLAAYGEHPSAVKVLVDNNADLSMADENGSTALHEAVGRVEVVRVLPENGAEVDVMNNEGQTPLYLSANRER